MKVIYLAATMMAMAISNLAYSENMPEQSIASILVNTLNMSRLGTAKYLNIKVISGANLGNSILTISLDTPQGDKLPENISFKLMHKKIRQDGLTYFDWEELNAVDYVKQEDNNFILALPSLTELDVTDLSIGWVGLKPNQLGAKITLTDETNNKAVKRWKGTAYRSSRKVAKAPTLRMNCDAMPQFNSKLASTCI